MALSKDTLGREIITDAVCGKGRKHFAQSYAIRPANRPTTIGGCWVMNHTCEGELDGDAIAVRGRFDANVWYSYDGNSETAVAKDTMSYSEQIPLLDLDPECDRADVRVVIKVLQSPTCVDARIGEDGTEIEVKVQMELAAEIVGKTKLYVLTMGLSQKKDFDEESSFVEEESTV